MIGFGSALFVICSLCTREGRAADVFLETERKDYHMFSPEERRRAVELYSATPMTTAQVVRHLGYPTRQCLERWLAKDPRYAGHMRNPSSHWRQMTKAVEPVPDGMRGSGPPNGSARASELSTTGSRRIVRAAWPRCSPGTGTPARPTSLRRDEAGMPGPSAMTWRRCAAGSRSWNWRTR